MTAQTSPETKTETQNGELPKPPPPIPEAIVKVLSSDSDEGALAPFASEAAFVKALRIANALASSTLVPEAYRGKDNIPNVLIALEMANRIGASVFMIMQNLDVIHGRPGWRSQFLIATLNTCGRFSALRFEWEGKQGSDEWGCRAVATDLKTKERCAGALITIGLAKAEGWYGRNGSKWKTMPEQMLMYRAGAFFTRVYAPELSIGMHTAEELADFAPSDVPQSITSGDAKKLEGELLGTQAAAPEKPKGRGKKRETIDEATGEIVDPDIAPSDDADKGP